MILKKLLLILLVVSWGICFFAAGVGAYHIAMFHLFTHAFFKALLFLGAGSVIPFSRRARYFKMGGVWKRIPFTTVLMLIGTLALTGFPFLSGFYSKDAIIEFAYLKDTPVGYYASVVGVITALLTTVYSWRLFFKVFFGKYNNKSNSNRKTHESPLIMIAPLIVLAIGSISRLIFL